MNLKKIGKHIFFFPIYVAIGAFIGYGFYAVALMISDVFLWICEDLLFRIPVAVTFVWIMAIFFVLLNGNDFFAEDRD